MNYCEECGKSFSTKYNLRRHFRSIHDESNDNDEDDSDDSSENESMDVTEDKSSTKTDDNDDDSSFLSTDSESFIDTDDDDGLEKEEQKLWQDLLTRAINVGKNFPKIKNVRELWEDEGNLQKAKNEIQNLIWKLQYYISSLNKGQIYPAIKNEIRSLRRNGYYKKESWNKAWDNRLYLIEMLLRDNEDHFQKILDDESTTSSSSSSSEKCDDDADDEDEEQDSGYNKFYSQL